MSEIPIPEGAKPVDWAAEAQRLSIENSKLRRDQAELLAALKQIVAYFDGGEPGNDPAILSTAQRAIRKAETT